MKPFTKYFLLLFIVSLQSQILFSQNEKDTVTQLYGFKKTNNIDSSIVGMGYGGTRQFIHHWYDGDTLSGSFNYFLPDMNIIISGQKKEGKWHGALIVIEPSKKYMKDNILDKTGNAWPSNADHHKILKYYYFDNDTLLFMVENKDFQGVKELSQSSFTLDKLNPKIAYSSTRLFLKKGKINSITYFFVHRKKQYLFDVYFKKGELYKVQGSVT